MLSINKQRQLGVNNPETHATFGTHDQDKQNKKTKEN